MIKLAQAGRAKRCALCHADEDGALLVCAGCASALHPDCAASLRVCPTRGCAKEVDPSLAYATRRTAFDWRKSAAPMGGSAARDRIRWAQRAEERAKNSKRCALAWCAAILLAALAVGAL